MTFDTLDVDTLSQLADETLPGGRAGVMFRWFLSRRAKLGEGDVTIRPKLLRAWERRQDLSPPPCFDVPEYTAMDDSELPF
jgi:hypothetical protein